MGLPAPPEPRQLDPLTSTWAAGKPLVRVHHAAFTPASFNPGGGRGRFHPFRDETGLVVPTLYAADSVDGALSETVFRAVPLAGPARRLRAAQLRPLRLSTLVPTRALRLAALYGHGLGRLGLARRDLIDTEAVHYPETVRWAAALHAAPGALDGLEWVSRQDASRAVVLFGDRVGTGVLETGEGPISLDRGAGWERALEAAEAAGILILV